MNTQMECERCLGSGEIHSNGCLVRKWIFNERSVGYGSQRWAMEMAVMALNHRRTGIESDNSGHELELDQFVAVSSS